MGRGWGRSVLAWFDTSALGLWMVSGDVGKIRKARTGHDESRAPFSRRTARASQFLGPLLLLPRSVRRVESAHIPLERGGARRGWIPAVASELGCEGGVLVVVVVVGMDERNQPQPRDAVDVEFKLRSPHNDCSRS